MRTDARAARMSGATSERNRSTGPTCGAAFPRRTTARDPSANTQSRACTQRRVDPKRSVRAPAAFVEAIPPMVQNAPLDGSTGKRSPTDLARASTRFRIAPGPTTMRRVATSGSPILSRRLRSTMTPFPMAPPGMLLPDARGTMATRLSPAHRTSATTSSALAGTATACGITRLMPAASAYTARAATSSRNMPRNPWPGAPSFPVIGWWCAFCGR